MKPDQPTLQQNPWRRVPTQRLLFAALSTCQGQCAGVKHMSCELLRSGDKAGQMRTNFAQDERHVACRAKAAVRSLWGMMISLKPCSQSVSSHVSSHQSQGMFPQSAGKAVDHFGLPGSPFQGLIDGTCFPCLQSAMGFSKSKSDLRSQWLHPMKNPTAKIGSLRWVVHSPTPRWYDWLYHSQLVSRHQPPCSSFRRLSPSAGVTMPST